MEEIYRLHQTSRENHVQKILRISALMKKRHQKMYKNKSFIPFSFILIDILSPSSLFSFFSSPKNLSFPSRFLFQVLHRLFCPLSAKFPRRDHHLLAHLLRLLWFDIQPGPPTEVALFRSAVTPECQV